MIPYNLVHSFFQVCFFLIFFFSPGFVWCFVQKLLGSHELKNDQIYLKTIMEQGWKGESEEEEKGGETEEEEEEEEESL